MTQLASSTGMAQRQFRSLTWMAANHGVGGAFKAAAADTQMLSSGLQSSYNRLSGPKRVLGKQVHSRRPVLPVFLGNSP